MQDFNQLKKFEQIDKEKHFMIMELEKNAKRHMMEEAKLSEKSVVFHSKGIADDASEMMEFSYRDADYDLCEAPILRELQEQELPKVCPNCARRFPQSENICPDCLVGLKPFTDKIQIRDIKTNPVFTTEGGIDNDNILTDENFQLINDFDFTIDDFNRITHSIKAQAYKNLDNLIKENEIDLNDLEIFDKVLLFAKSFVIVDYKSYGQDLGYFEFNKISIDDRLTKSLQITTLIHEITHFLIKEILLHVICKILNLKKNNHVESVITYILTSSNLNRLIDEYAAHSVEGRFTMFGYQDYSSFRLLQDEIDPEHVEIAKTIGNTFAVHIKEMLEGFLDWDLREEIKKQFLSDTIEGPDYRQLALESCKKLSDEGFLKAIWLILTEGFKNVDGEALESYMKEF